MAISVPTAPNTIPKIIPASQLLNEMMRPMAHNPPTKIMPAIAMIASVLIVAFVVVVLLIAMETYSSPADPVPTTDRVCNKSELQLAHLYPKGWCD